MEQKISEREFIETFNKSSYADLVKDVYDQIRESPNFKSQPCAAILTRYHIKDPDGNETGKDIIVEASLVKKEVFGVGMHDFGITSLTITDEPASDDFLDRTLVYIKLKEKIEKDIK
jgi:hypothetical protein